MLSHGFETMSRDQSVWLSRTLIASRGDMRLFPFLLLNFCTFLSLPSLPSSLLPSPSPRSLPSAQGLVNNW